jgi:hypothetical protein
MARFYRYGLKDAIYSYASNRLLMERLILNYEETKISLKKRGYRRERRKLLEENQMISNYIISLSITLAKYEIQHSLKHII